jgi:sugar phosphate isomerase/epimerase
MSSIPVALQMWSVRDDFNTDFAATVKKVAAIGYPAVELAGYGNLSAADAAAALREAGLRVVGMHVGLDRLQTDLDAVLSEARLFESPFITCPYYDKSKFKTAKDGAALGGILNGIGAAVRGAGLRFAYHNHDGEFQKIEGRFVMDWILDAADPRNLEMELDVYWSTVAGADTPAWLRQAGRRTTQIHLKDVEELGASGKVDFPAILQAVAGIGAAEVFIIEQEKYNHAPLESVRLSLEAFRSWSGA